MRWKEKETAESRQLKRLNVKSVCGAKTRSGSKCLKGAGWGTVHPGTGRCKLHAGSAPSSVRAAAKAEYRKLLGNPIETTPEQAIITCIHIRSGEVQWLTERMAELEKTDWLEDTAQGKQLHIYARERQAAMNDLVRFSQIAISLNIEERKVRLAETYGELIAQFAHSLMNDFMPYMIDAGKREAKAIVRKNLLALESGSFGNRIS